MSTCPDENRWVEFTEGLLGERECRELEDHLDLCPRCTSLLALFARKSEAKEPGPLPEPDLPSAGVPSEDALLPGGRVGRFVLLERVGTGGMGIVYAAHDPRLDRKVALKLLHPALLGQARGGSGPSRMLREAQAAARLAHPHVITVHEVGSVGDQVFVAMEFVDGGTLSRWQREAPRRWEELTGKYLQAGQGLAAAHRAGLVHRDFKPDNVLLGRDGRVRVADFGLARGTFPDVPSGPAGALHPPVSGPLTRTGALLGTPAYMSPEQHQGREVGAPSDQFSFCVAFYEALHGERPFSGSDSPALLEEMSHGRIRPPPRGTAVPSWLRQVLLRGLSFSPEQRFPSMEALLTAVEQGRKRRGRRMALALGSLALVAVIAGGAWVRTRAAAQCQGLEARLQGIWDAERKARIRERFLAVGKIFAQSAWSRVEQTLDGYSDTWLALQRQTCEAPARDRTEWGEFLGAQRVCLRERLSELGALTTVLAGADEETVVNAVRSALSLGRLDSCTDARTLTSWVRPPREPERAAAVESLRGELAEVKALLDVGRFHAGTPRAEAAVARARSLEYRPVLAEALFLLGVGQGNLGDFPRAEETLTQAVLAALAGGHDREAARAWTLLAFIVGKGAERDTARARLLLRHAEAAGERFGGDPELTARRLTYEGELAFVDGRFEETLERYQKALELRRRFLPSHHPDIGTSLTDMAGILGQLGRYEEAVALSRSALANLEAALGPHHPDVAYALQSLGSAEAELGRSEEALAFHQRALEIFESVYGAESHTVAVALTYVGIQKGNLGRHEEALKAHRRSLALWEKLVGPEHPDVATCLQMFGGALREAGRPGEALEVLRRSLRIRQRSLPEHDPQWGMLNQELAATLVALGRPSEALEVYRSALGDLERALGPEHPDVGRALTGQGRALLAMKEPRAALGPLERAVALWERTKGNPGRVEAAHARFALARALTESGGDTRRAILLARQARELFAARAPAERHPLEEITGWLRQHGESIP
ncbi:tetratricopeptide repeat protein [Archangium violaceum]|uniref:serine/threonine-protein kinase n=1 Tax=Archangium violaceum TaxID=83451 RepID=UPI00193BA4B9|nr:serine/threonine-protein kinase [Archangium violaceum]QRK08233.1 tetratricopeptide repeat protein [Archangium violaceum]